MRLIKIQPGDRLEDLGSADRIQVIKDDYRRRLELGDEPVVFVDALTSKEALGPDHTVEEHLAAAKEKYDNFLNRQDLD